MDESPMSAANAGTNTRTMRMGISLPVWRTKSEPSLAIGRDPRDWADVICHATAAHPHQLPEMSRVMDQMLDQAVTRWNLLDHSFYQRWTHGTLTRDELCDYIKQYGHVVRAVPRWLEQVRGGDTAQLARHVDEERSHVALWEKFGEALGLTSEAIRTAPANEPTTRLLARGDHLAEQGHAAAVVWALEAQTPAVAEAKLAGLSAVYRIKGDASCPDLA